MKNIYAFIIFILLGYEALSQSGPLLFGGARGDGVGGADIGFADINALFANPAGIAFLDTWQATVTARNRFSVMETSTLGMAVALPIDDLSGIGLMASYHGFEAYNETKIGLAYARRLIPDLSVGFMIDYQGFRIPEYGDRHTLTFEAGAQAVLLRNFRVGVYVYSPVRVEVSEEDYIRPYFALGGTWQVSNSLMIHVKAAQDIAFRPSAHAGIEYRLIEILYLRAGISTNPVENAFGIGIIANNLRFDIATLFHPSLGMTPSLSVSYIPSS